MRLGPVCFGKCSLALKFIGEIQKVLQQQGPEKQKRVLRLAG